MPGKREEEVVRSLICPERVDMKLSYTVAAVKYGKPVHDVMTSDYSRVCLCCVCVFIVCFCVWVVYVICVCVCGLCVWFVWVLCVCVVCVCCVWVCCGCMGGCVCDDIHPLQE